MDTMKKLGVGIGVIGVFVAYSIWVRQETPVIAKPSSLASSATSTQSGTSTAANTTTQSTTAASVGSSTTSTTYTDGTYKGSVEDAYYGNVQVAATISGGKLTDVTFLQYPNTHSDSVMINRQAMPYLQQEAIQAQSANVQVISGATFTSQAFIQSLTNALSSAKA